MKKVEWKDVFSKESSTDIIFMSRDTKKILNLVGNDVSKGDKLIIDKKGKTECSFLDEDTITEKQLGAIFTGSKIFVRNNIGSFYDYLNSKNK